MKLSLLHYRSLQLGQVYLDILISVVILIILFHALLTLLLLAFELVGFTRARSTAKHLAQEKIELIRNLPYDKIGTLGGIPPGTLSQVEKINRNGLTYSIKTTVMYIDDPFDQQAPQDLLPTDYKRVRISITWPGIAESATNPVTFITDISPKGVETTVGGGTLSILVFDSEGKPISQAEVVIQATEVTPPINMTLQTSDDGRIILPGAPVCTSCYQVSATKDGYSYDRTYSIEEIVHPYKPHLTILEGQLSEVSFAIDRLSSLVVSSRMDRNNDFAPLANAIFKLRGGKIIGTDINDDPVYKYEEGFTTDSYGRLIITNLEWDNYYLFLPELSSWNISGTNPLQPFAINPNEQADISFSLTPKTLNNLLVSFQDVAQQPIASVAALLSNNLGVVASASSGLESDPDWGQVFFPGLENIVYHLVATASGFMPAESEITVSGAVQDQVILNPL